VLYVDGMNLYEYVRSGPTRFVDPSGRNLTESAPEAYGTSDKSKRTNKKFATGGRDSLGGMGRRRLPVVCPVAQVGGGSVGQESTCSSVPSIPAPGAMAKCSAAMLLEL